MNEQVKDHELMGYVARGDKKAFGVLVQRYYRMLYMVMVRITDNAESAKDITQDLFARLWENRRKISPGTSVRNYLLVSARNAAYNHNRLSRRHDPLDGLPEKAAPASLDVIELETARQLVEAIDRLPPRSAEIIRFTLEGLDQKSIAEQMNISVATVKALKSAGIKKLKERLGPFYTLLGTLL